MLTLWRSTSPLREPWHLARYVGYAVKRWYLEAVQRADERYRMRVRRFCPFCGTTWRQDGRISHHQLNDGRWYRTFTCSNCGEWWLNVCEHRRLKMDRAYWDERALCLDCREWISGAALYLLMRSRRVSSRGRDAD